MPGPVLSLPDLLQALEAPRAAARKVVLTNGVFDLLHVGHLRYLREARSRGDLLVVGVNDDASARTQGKGGNRPIVPQAERAELVAALAPVDYVIVFGESTADALLETVRPAVYAKGADYDETTLPEADTARRVGARLAFIPLLPGHSTTELLRRLGGSQ